MTAVKEIIGHDDNHIDDSSNDDSEEDIDDTR